MIREDLGDVDDPCLAVWALSHEWLINTGNAFVRAGKRFPIGFVHAPYNCCPNLGAQEGAFTTQLIDPAKLRDKVEESPVNLLVADIAKELSDNPQIVVDANFSRRLADNGPLLLFTLPVIEAHSLLRELMREGFHAAKHFPGFSGAAKAVFEMGSCC